jgi:multidrug efflux pump subunit AcrB
MSQKKHEFSISSWAVDNRVTVYIFTILIVITGLIAYVTMPREDFPEIIENKIYISSVFPGIRPKMSRNSSSNRLKRKSRTSAA